MKTWREKAYKLNRFDTVIKVGGSIISGEQCAAVAACLGGAASSTRGLIVPGGGDIDIMIEARHERTPLQPPVFHHSTLLAQDQMGLFLCNMSPKLVAVESILDAERALASARMPVLLPSRLILTLDVFRYTNRVSSDTMSAYIAWLIHVPELVLLKSRKPKTVPVTYETLRADDGYVDEVFPDFVQETGLRVAFGTADDLQSVGLHLAGKNSDLPIVA